EYYGVMYQDSRYNDQLIVVQEWVDEGLSNIVKRCIRYGYSNSYQPDLGGLGHEGGIQLLREGLAILEPRGEIDKPGVGGPFGLAHGLRQHAKELLLIAHDEEPAVLGAVKLAGGQ